MAEQATVGRAQDARSKAVWTGLLRRVIGTIDSGTLSVDLPSGHRVMLAGAQRGRDAHVRLHRWGALSRLALRGDLGFAEAICEAGCSSNDLKTLLLWALDNSEAGGVVGQGFAASRISSRLRHGFRANTRRNSRRNIADHYDLGNAFYAAWLDQDLSYSSGIYPTAVSTLEEAQAAKIARVAEFLELRGGERVLEIGCGWGALAQNLIARHGCHVTGLTLSTEQFDHTRERLRSFEGRSDIRLQDYRDVSGTFDRIASIEMIEAVGEAFWPVYFDKIASCLSSEGTAVLQAITIDERYYESYRRRPDFIQLNIFPGGMLPTKSIIAAQAARAGLRVCRTDHFGASYTRTLADWRTRFERAWPAISMLGFDERFRRLWDYYLVYCEAGFEWGLLDVGLYQLRHEK
jgi:cyclopropane-fatty-acyl-phospholipid synthase